jgi:dolichol-phosphate mannosyltransferase
MKAPMAELSIILPAFKETDHVEATVRMLRAFLIMDYEVVVVVDFPEDPTLDSVRTLVDEFPELRYVINRKGRGAIYAIQEGIASAQAPVVLLHVIDDLGPIFSFNSMFQLISEGCDFVGANRYTHGGKRYGGSPLSQFLSRFGNSILYRISRNCFIDGTTGIKMFRKALFQSIELESAPVGWAAIYEFTLKLQSRDDVRFGEVPVVSIDRPFGGESTFRPGAWMAVYLKWFLWGLTHIKFRHSLERRGISGPA